MRTQTLLQLGESYKLMLSQMFYIKTSRLDLPLLGKTAHTDHMGKLSLYYDVSNGFGAVYLFEKHQGKIHISEVVVLQNDAVCV